MTQAVATTTDTAPTSNRKTKLTDSIRTHFAGDAPVADKVKGFARARPWTSAAFAGIGAIMVANVLRGRF